VTDSRAADLYGRLATPGGDGRRRAQTRAMLQAPGIIPVLPDILAHAGGATVSNGCAT